MAAPSTAAWDLDDARTEAQKAFSQDIARADLTDAGRRRFELAVLPSSLSISSVRGTRCALSSALVVSTVLVSGMWCAINFVLEDTRWSTGSRQGAGRKAGSDRRSSSA